MFLLSSLSSLLSQHPLLPWPHTSDKPLSRCPIEGWVISEHFPCGKQIALFLPFLGCSPSALGCAYHCQQQLLENHGPCLCGATPLPPRQAHTHTPGSAPAATVLIPTPTQAAPCTPHLIPQGNHEPGCLQSSADAASAFPSPARAGSEEDLILFLSFPTLLVTFHFHYTGKTSIDNQLEKGKATTEYELSPT